MPIVTITIRRPKTPEFKAEILEVVHAALVRAGVNQNDRFHRVIELGEPDFHYDQAFPDVRTKRTDDFVLIEILLGVGRSVKVKKQILSDMVEQLSAHGFDPENVMVVFQDVPWENWSPAGGRVPHA
jgi:phenylpyruvate tautomerase PptA (4-oxalocrotonate tautomerase family)